MKNKHLKPFSGPMQSIQHLLMGMPDALLTPLLASKSACSGSWPYGYHCHDAWEVFCPLRRNLVFECQVGEPFSVETGTPLLVASGCLHAAIETLHQDDELLLLVLGLPGRESPHATLLTGGIHSLGGMSLGTRFVERWEALLGTKPDQLLDHAASDLKRGFWGQAAALARIRLLFSTLGELLNKKASSVSGTNPVALVLNHLQSRYYDPGLDINTLSVQAKLSQAHLARLFKQVTGRTVHQTLIDIRLKRAEHLLKQYSYRVKEVAEMTGWSNQLYFSAVFRRRYGFPPSHIRSTHESEGLESYDSK